MKVAQSRYKCYADKQRNDKEFKVGDHVLLKVSLLRGVVRFDQKRGKLSPWYIGPFEILERIGKVAYRLALPPTMLGVHNVFHISMLKKCAHNPEHEIDFNDLEVNNNVTYSERLIRILDHGVKKLRNKEIPQVKVQWKHHNEGEASWELESEMREKFPFLFSTA